MKLLFRFRFMRYALRFLLSLCFSDKMSICDLVLCRGVLIFSHSWFIIVLLLGGIPNAKNVIYYYFAHLISPKLCSDASFR